jgi:hypothetical protein
LREGLCPCAADIAGRRHQAIRLADQQAVQQRIAARAQRCIADCTRARTE